MELKIKKLSPRIGADIPEPFFASAGAAAMDLHALLDGPLTLAPGQRELVGTGIAIALPGSEFVALVFARSGLAAKHGITLANCVGVIDSDYRGEIKVPLINLSGGDYTIAPGDRIAQIAVMPVVRPVLCWADRLEDSQRGENGFGSTGI